MSIYIKYTNDNWLTSTKFTVDAILDRKISSVVKTDGQSLRGFDYSHKKFSKTKRLIRISADQLEAGTQKTKIRELWTAGALRYSADDSTYIDVKLDKDGDYTPEFIDDDENLEEIEFTLIYKDPN